MLGYTYYLGCIDVADVRIGRGPSGGRWGRRFGGCSRALRLLGVTHPWETPCAWGLLWHELLWRVEVGSWGSFRGGLGDELGCLICLVALHGRWSSARMRRTVTTTADFDHQ